MFRQPVDCFIWSRGATARRDLRSGWAHSASNNIIDEDLERWTERGGMDAAVTGGSAGSSAGEGCTAPRSMLEADYSVSSRQDGLKPWELAWGRLLSVLPHTAGQGNALWKMS